MNTKKMTMKPQGHHGLQTNGRNMKSLNTTLSALALKSALTATVLALLVAASPAQGRNPNPGIIPPGSMYRGQSYGEWGAQWWKTIFSIPVVNGYHPLFIGGALGEQRRIVFFTAAAGRVTIGLTIPVGSSLCLPVIKLG